MGIDVTRNGKRTVIDDDGNITITSVDDDAVVQNCVTSGNIVATSGTRRTDQTMAGLKGRLAKKAEPRPPRPPRQPSVVSDPTPTEKYKGIDAAEALMTHGESAKFLNMCDVLERNRVITELQIWLDDSSQANWDRFQMTIREIVEAKMVPEASAVEEKSRASIFFYIVVIWAGWIMFSAAWASLVTFLFGSAYIHGVLDERKVAKKKALASADVEEKARQAAIDAEDARLTAEILALESDDDDDS